MKTAISLRRRSHRPRAASARDASRATTSRATARCHPHALPRATVALRACLHLLAVWAHPAVHTMTLAVHRAYRPHEMGSRSALYGCPLGCGTRRLAPRRACPLSSVRSRSIMRRLKRCCCDSRPPPPCTRRRWPPPPLTAPLSRPHRTPDSVRVAARRFQLCVRTRAHPRAAVPTRAAPGGCSAARRRCFSARAKLFSRPDHLRAAARMRPRVPPPRPPSSLPRMALRPFTWSRIGSRWHRRVALRRRRRGSVDVLRRAVPRAHAEL